ncbi:MAG: hydrogenase maturation nickel metallochaperone HypA [SAR324 cluster bacterium]|nr:hydrogenase maturation nickel metallochaperone HypA [SAR324 cluster bacterium]
MHEISLMENIVEIVLREAEKARASQVLKIGLRVGEKSGVVMEALTFAFEVVTKNTVAEGAVLEIEAIPLMGECQNCGHQFHAEDGFLVCDKCQGFAKILSGQELNIDFIEVNE